MGQFQTTSRQEGAGHVTGVPKSSRGLTASDQYEYGSMVAQSAGRYKAFQTSFGAAPLVILSPLATAGSLNVYLMGTPAAGSFRARTDRAGSRTVHFMAFGQR